jgi:hypothetical protein
MNVEYNITITFWIIYHGLTRTTGQNEYHHNYDTKYLMLSMIFSRVATQYYWFRLIAAVRFIHDILSSDGWWHGKADMMLEEPQAAVWRSTRLETVVVHCKSAVYWKSVILSGGLGLIRFLFREIRNTKHIVSVLISAISSGLDCKLFVYEKK